MIVSALAAAAIALIWAGYPLAMAALARLRRTPELPSGPMPTVTVVIATRDDPPAARRRVADVLAGDYPPSLLTVVVGLDAAGALTTRDQMGAADGRVVAVEGDPPGGKAATLNAAVRAATGDVLVFTDAGQTFDASCIRQLVTALRDPRFGAVSGRLEIESGAEGVSLGERYWRYERWLRRSEARVHSTVGVTGAVYAMHRPLWTPLPPGLILDDVFGPMRLVLDGYRVGFVDAARATDARRFDASQEYRRKARTLTGVLQLCAWLPAVLVPWRNPVWIQFVMHKLARLLTPYLALAVVGGLAWETLAAGWRHPRTVAPALAAIGLGAAAALLHPALRARVRRVGGQAIAMQVAIVVATANGLRGRWDVWQRR